MTGPTRALVDRLGPGRVGLGLGPHAASSPAGRTYTSSSSSRARWGAASSRPSRSGCSTRCAAAARPTASTCRCPSARQAEPGGRSRTGPWPWSGPRPAQRWCRPRSRPATVLCRRQVGRDLRGGVGRIAPGRQAMADALGGLRRIGAAAELGHDRRGSAAPTAGLGPRGSVPQGHRPRGPRPQGQRPGPASGRRLCSRPSAPPARHGPRPGRPQHSARPWRGTRRPGGPARAPPRRHRCRRRPASRAGDRPACAA